MKKGSKISPYLLLDYTFLQDYQIIDTYNSNTFNFIAQIKNTTQLVKFTKVQYTQKQFGRFQALIKLFKTGVVLADNIFILEQGGEYYFYIIEAYIQNNSYSNPDFCHYNNNNNNKEDKKNNKKRRFKERFLNLQHFLMFNNQMSLDQRKQLFNKIKVLLERVHHSGQFYGGLTSEKILIDDENNVYLAPFKLVHQLPNSLYENAYRPPEVLNKILNNQFQIEEKNLGNWDIWSFGCICLQIFVTCSPFYHSVSIKSQLDKINSAEFLEEEINSLELPLQNLIFNCLIYSPELRSLTSQKKMNTTLSGNNNKKDLNKEKKLKYFQNSKFKTKQQRQRQTEKNTQKKNSIQGTQQNNIGDSQLIFHLLSISNIQIIQQLKILVHLGKPYHYYLDRQKNLQNDIIQLDKKIIIKDSFQSFIQMLNEQVLIQIKQNQKQANFKINLQTLILTYEGKRIWDKQLIGSYEIEQNQFYPKLKIKLSCMLKSPSIIDQKSFEDNKKILAAINENCINALPNNNNLNRKQTKERSKSDIINNILPKKLLNNKQNYKEEEIFKEENKIPAKINFDFDDNLGKVNINIGQVLKNQSKEPPKASKFKTQLACIQDVKQSLSQLTNHWKNRAMITPIGSSFLASKQQQQLDEQFTKEKIKNILSIK